MDQDEVMPNKNLDNPFLKAKELKSESVSVPLLSGFVYGEVEPRDDLPEQMSNLNINSKSEKE